MKTSLFRRYLLPGFVFQSVVIAGGYGTGREIAEFFLSLGPVTGLFAVGAATIVWSAVCAASFEFARTFGCHDYHTFFHHLLGRAGILYELCYFVFLGIVLAVIAAAAGSILEETFGIGYLWGVLGMMGGIGVLVFLGSPAIEKFFAGWSLALYAVYVILFVWAAKAFGDQVLVTLRDAPLESGWMVGGVKYAAYNLALIPPLLFSIRHVRNRREALWAGVLAGPIAIVPGLLFYLAMVAFYPDIVDRAVPANHILEALGSRTFQISFQIVLFGTLIETGTGMIHGVNERVATAFARRGATMAPALRSGVALGLLLAGALIAQYGLIALIARGYGTLTWIFLVVYVVPVLTWGVMKQLRMNPGV